MSAALRNIILILMATAAAVLLLTFVFIRPQMAGIEQIRMEIQQQKLKIANLDQQISNYQTAIEELRRVKEGREKVAQMFPGKEELVDQVEQLEAALSASGLSWELQISDSGEPGFGREQASQARANEMSRTPVVAGLTKLEEAPYKLILAGTYREISDFFLRFDHLTFISEAEKITVNAESEQDQATETLENTGEGRAIIEAVFFVRK